MCVCRSYRSVLFGPYCNADRGELTSFITMNRHVEANSTHPLVALDERITAFTSLPVGKFAHKR